MDNNTLGTTRQHRIKIQSNQTNRELDLFLSFVWNESQEGEEWKEIPNLDARYYISSNGRVLSLCCDGYKLLQQFVCGSGYYYVDLRRNGEDVKKRVSRLVAEAFLENGDTSCEVHHKDVDKKNNKASNLEYIPKKEHLRLHKKQCETISLDTIQQQI